MTIKSVAVFHCTSAVGCAWACADGVVTTLLDMGYEVLNCANPATTSVAVDLLRAVDLIILMAPEWYHESLLGRYGHVWDRLKAPKVAWYAESFHRDDRDFDFRDVRDLADLHYFPAKQDAIEFSGHWLPFGADTKIFYPRPVRKQHAVAFLGKMYPKRRDYIKRIKAPVDVLLPVYDPDIVTSFFRLAEAYSSVRIFVNLPSYSRLLVTKVTEVMACRTLLITPEIDHPSGHDNQAQFENGKHLFYYRPDRPEIIGDIVAMLLSDFKRLEAVTEEGWIDVQHHHTLRGRLDTIVVDVAALMDSARSRGRPRLASAS